MYKKACVVYIYYINLYNKPYTIWTSIKYGKNSEMIS